MDDVLSTRLVVVGAGQAGIEAALAASKMGVDTLCVTMRLDRIGHLPCNCSIGGPAKGHMAREVDALGGQMGLTTDRTMTHLRRVGAGRGPAVQTLRAHVCKQLYPAVMRQTLERQERLQLLEGAVVAVNTSNGTVTGCTVQVEGGLIEVDAQAVLLTTGTFLNALCHEGSRQTSAARFGDRPSLELSSFLADVGIRLRRFKTGTTPRVHKDSIDFARVAALPSEPEFAPFSFANEGAPAPEHLLPCWSTRTTAETHDVLRDHLHESAMFSGAIQGVGPRYCPSVEDKVVRFADKDSHPVWLEQETWSGPEMYVQGMSTSLPAHVQIEALRTIPGLEHVEMIRPGYAVEYDMADPLQLDPHLMSKQIKGLFLAGQINGTSGYEEAAGQGMVAGINAAQRILEREPLALERGTAFIGVMIDDLVTKGVDDPYRMLTGRAEHRLLLRHDNADARLTPIARSLGICSDDRWRKFEDKMERVATTTASFQQTYLSSADNPVLVSEGEAPLTGRVSLFEFLQRPSVDVARAAELSGKCGKPISLPDCPRTREQVGLAAAFDGYIQIQERQVLQTRSMDRMRIPSDFDFQRLSGLSHESKEKLGRIAPLTIGQASRVPGVRPADIALLIGHLKGAQERPNRTA